MTAGLFAQIRRETDRFRAALSLLTRIPIGPVPEGSIMPWGQLAPCYPWVGLLIGLILAAAATALNWFSPGTPFLNSILLLALWIGITGGLHLDGWADCADGLFTPVPPARRLEIMSDPRLGAFGVMGLSLLLLLKTSALMHGMVILIGRWNARGIAFALIPFLLAPLVGRSAAILVLLDSAIPTARPGGMGDFARRGLPANRTLLSLGAALLTCLFGRWRGIAMALIGTAVGWGFARWAKGRVGGITGDVLGGVIELGETAALAAAVWGN